MSFTVVIPSRYASTRLPAKALADIDGKPMVQSVYERAAGSSANTLWVATDDERIESVLKEFGSNVLMTSPDHPSGTDRLAEVVELLELPDDAILVNVQGDEPLIPPAVIDQVAENLANNSDCACATLCELIESKADFLNPSCVKVVADGHGKALYFSRAPIPWPRDYMNTDQSELPSDLNARRHIGIYAYRAGLLREFVKWDMAPLESTESLEQLRILANGKSIHVDLACEPVPAGVDTQEDLEKVRALLSKS